MTDETTVVQGQEAAAFPEPVNGTASVSVDAAPADGDSAKAAARAPKKRATRATTTTTTPRPRRTTKKAATEAAPVEGAPTANEAPAPTPVTTPVIAEVAPTQPALPAMPESAGMPAETKQKANSEDGAMNNALPSPNTVETASHRNDEATPPVVDAISAPEAPFATNGTASEAPPRVPAQRTDNRVDNRQDNRQSNNNREERAVEARGLRFRGRDGRAEIRGRNEARPFRARNERGPDNRNDNRNDNWRGDGDNRVQRDVQRPNNRDRNADRDNNDRLSEREVARGRNEHDLISLEERNLPELVEIAGEMGIGEAANLQKNQLVFKILEAQAETSGNLFKRGILEILSDGKGFLRTSGYLPGDEDVYVSQSQIKRFNLKTGDTVSGQVRPPKDMERHYGLLRVEAIDGEAPENMRQRKEFEKMTPIFPDEKFKLETSQDNITARIIDLVSPIGKGQRGLIVAPPKAGKTTLIKNIANSIALNHPEVLLIVLLIDERPEEVTDISRSVRGEVVASTFDEMPENHMRVAEMVFEKAKRLVEQHKDVVILLDSITRLSRASNLVVTPSGRTLSGGLDPAAMYRPKRMFGAARNIEEGGSLTILATTLVDTGSRMDDMIFEEFKGTGNMDLVLDRNLFDQRVFPAIDINKSGTRRDDLLMSKEDLAATYHLRRTLSALDNDKAITLLIDRLKNTKTNSDFMQIVQKSARQGTQQS
jgi:transcription termination factor Rho